MTPTTVWRLPGLTPDRRDTGPAWLHQLIHADESRLASSFADLALALRADPGLRESVASLAGAPVAEVAASPFALRACAWAVSEGFFSVAHETRMPIRWPEPLRGGSAVDDPLHDTWDEGRLHIGKYQSFLQDEPLVTRNPDLHAKWTPHELLHRVMRFLWRPGVSLRSLHHGARLNELLPVVLWYGLDEVLRLDGRPFRRSTAPLEPEATDDRVHWWTLAPAGLVDRARPELHAFRAGLDHYRHEMQAISRGIASSAVVSVPHPFLDAASDATAYVVGHGRRLRSPTVARLLTTLYRPGRDRDEDPRAAFERVRTGLATLLFDEIVLDVALARSRASARILQDWLHRSAHAVTSERHPVLELLPDAATDIDRALDHADPVDLDAWRRRLEVALSSSAGTVLASGLPTTTPTPLAIARLGEGLASCLPATRLWLSRQELLDSALREFLQSPEFARRRSLPIRFRDWLVRSALDPVAEALAAFEQSLLTLPSGDDAAEFLALSPEEIDDPERVEVRASDAFVLHVSPIDVAALHQALLEDSRREHPLPAVTRRESPMVLGRRGGEIAAVALTPPIAAAFEALQREPDLLPHWMHRLEQAVTDSATDPGASDHPADDEAWMDELVEAGAVVLCPIWDGADLRPA